MAERGRKTVEVKSLINKANIQLARTDAYADTKFKSGVCAMVETVLYNSNNYDGFGFLDNDNSEVGTLGYYSRKYNLKKHLLK